METVTKAPSVIATISKKIKSGRRGRLLFPSDFSNIAKQETVRKALKRLEDAGLLLKVAHGIYIYPEKSNLFGYVKPSYELIAKEIAKRDKARIIPSGAYALNALGLSTQIPMRVVYLTDGTPREVKLGKRGIRFKSAHPKYFQMRNKVNQLVVQALRHLGQDQVDESDLVRISDVLHKQPVEEVKRDAKFAPEWIRRIMLDAIT
jgi:DNA-binding transcriptional regulator YhcF (GntR family)